MAKISREKADVKAALIEQVTLLQLACKNYDGGTRESAKFLAVGLRVLLHQTPHSHSLLEQLGLRTGRFSEWPVGDDKPPSEIDGLRIEIEGARNLGTVSAALTSSCRILVSFTGPGGGEYIAPLSTFSSEVRRRFDHWWNDVIVRDQKQRTFNRRELVLEVANTDGGAHVDPKLEERYMDFSRKNSLGINFSANGRDWQALPSPHLACMRQIAHEVLITLHRRAPWSFANPYEFKDPLAGRDGFAIGGIRIETGP